MRPASAIRKCIRAGRGEERKKCDWTRKRVAARNGASDGATESPTRSFAGKWPHPLPPGGYGPGDGPLLADRPGPVELSVRPEARPCEPRSRVRAVTRPRCTRRRADRPDTGCTTCPGTGVRPGNWKRPPGPSP
jgi:hypothetical protein